MLVKVKNGIIEKYPYSIVDLKNDNRDVSFPVDITAEILQQYDVYEVVVADKPVFDSLQQKIIIRSEPVLVNDIWTLTWLVVNKTEEELAAQSKALQNTYIRAIQSHLDTKAQERGYDNIVSACSYAGYDNHFRAEGEAYGVWRANCWKYAYEQLVLILGGSREIPTVETFIQELPLLEV